VGQDVFGVQLIQSLHDAGVDVSRVKKSMRATGCASIYVAPDGENSIVLSPGANADLDPGEVRAVLEDLTADDFVLLQLEVPFETVQYALERAKAAGATSILDPAPGRQIDSTTLGLVRVLTPNQTEASMLLGSDSRADAEERELTRMGEETLRLGPKWVIFKLGENGCVVYSQNVRERVEAYRVTAADTTAAGDVFNGALAVALAEGRPMVMAAQFANAAAALSVTRAGAQSSIPTRDELNEFIERHPTPRPASLQ
jgi:ribokinase